MASIPRDIHEGLLEVRDSGLTNMFDRPGVQRVADSMDLPEVVAWIEANKDAYASWVFGKLEVER